MMLMMEMAVVDMVIIELVPLDTLYVHSNENWFYLGPSNVISFSKHPNPDFANCHVIKYFPIESFKNDGENIKVSRRMIKRSKLQ